MFDEATLIAERATGIGGSDVGSVLADKLKDTWGCRRRLQYEKRCVPKDFPEPSPAMRRGILLQSLALAEYKRKTGRHIDEIHSLYQSQAYPYMICHPDGFVWKKPEGDEYLPLSKGVLEAKVIGQWSFKHYKTQGLNEDYQLQMQHNLFVCGMAWGSFAILGVDPWEIECFDVEADPQVQQVLIAEEEKAWKEIKTDFWSPKLDANDRRCKSCAWRKTCQNL